MVNEKLETCPYLEKTIFGIEEQEGRKFVHFYGFGYIVPDDDSDHCYRFVEYTGAYGSLKDVITVGFDRAEVLSSEEMTQYLTDCTLSEICQIYNTYDNGKKPTEVYEISDDLPVGLYIYMSEPNWN